MTPHSEKILERLRALKPSLQKDMKISRLRVFGSVVRGEAGPESDVDLIVDFETLPGWEYFTLDKKIGEMLGGVKVDLATENSLHPRLKDKILSEARDVWT
jgi:predicted nucleotidyltransferase